MTSGSGTGKLALDPVLVGRARELARRAGQPVVELARGHTTVSVERALLRLAGVTGADPDGIPWVNRLVDAVVADVGLAHGVAVPVFDALLRELGPAPAGRDVGAAVTLLAQKAAAGSVRFEVPAGRAARSARAAARRAVGAGLRRIDRRRSERDRMVRRHGDPRQRPWIYLIVATGDIYEDIPQAQAAARAGADVIAVIRSTGQSLLDYVPEGRPGRVSPVRTRRRRTSG
ncbi:hypothetical protein GCM10027615_53340 [Plantactinospora veratri]